MCSVLIFIKPDNDHDDPSLDWRKFKAGDVIDISEFDNFNWGGDIQGPNALGWWSAVVVPRAQKAQLAYLMESGPMALVSIMPLNPADAKHQRRLWTVDITALAPEMSIGDFVSIVSAKPPAVDLNVIG